MQYFTKSWYEHLCIHKRGQKESADKNYWEKLKNPFEQYEVLFDAIKAQLPLCVQKDFILHDCQIVNAIYEGEDLVLELNNAGGFTRINKIRFVHCPPKNIAQIISAVWIYDEFSLAKTTRYKVGVLLAKGNHHIIEFIIPCDDIIVTKA